MKEGGCPVKKTILALAAAAAVLLSGCSSLLERDYLRLSEYESVSAAGEDSSALRVESYEGLVNALLYLIEQGAESGVLNLYNYTGDVADDLARACLEATQEDPYGAYAVEYIKHEYSLIVSYYQVDLTITYRRTQEELAQIVTVTGNSAIRRQLSNALTGYSQRVVLYLNFFDGDAGDLLELAQQAYYDAPAWAQGFPEIEISFYPDSGSQRIAELNLTYAEDAETLTALSQETQELAQDILEQSLGQEQQATALLLFDALEERIQPARQEEQAGSTAYAALSGGSTDSEGVALAYQLLCDLAGLDCVIVRGSLRGETHFWNIVTEDGQSRHVDLSAGLFALADDELTALDPYDWDRSEYPACLEEEA